MEVEITAACFSDCIWLVFTFPDNHKAWLACHISLDKINITNGCPEAAFSYVVPSYDGANPRKNPLHGLKITKKISLEEGGSLVRTTYKFTNNNPLKNEMELGFRIKNIPKPGSDLSGLKPLTKITKIIFATPSGNMDISSGAQINNLVFAPGGEKIGFLSKTPVKSGLWTLSPVIIQASNDRMSKTIR